MGEVAIGNGLALARRRRGKLAVALLVPALIFGPAPLGHAVPAPPPQPPVPVIDGPMNSHHRHQQTEPPPTAPETPPPGAPS